MLEKPDLPDEHLAGCLRDDYGLSTARIEFLPLGADVNTAVYRAISADGTPYFVKLRRGAFDELALIVPRLLADSGITQIIPPLPTQNHALWARLADFTVSLYPFIEGTDGFTVPITDQHWIDLGSVLKQIHTAVLPANVLDRIPRETYSGRWREIVRGFQASVEDTTFADPVAAELAAFLRSKRDVIDRLVGQAERLAAVLQTRPADGMLCHADIHVGNVLIDTSGTLFVVDWDTLIRAPKERDLMFAGGGLGGSGRTPEQEEALFYQGYGATDVDWVTLAYYRYERIVQDIAAYCEQLLLTDAGGEDRANSLRQLTGQFQPGEVIEIAFRSEAHLPPA